MAPTVCISDLSEERHCRVPFEYFLHKTVTPTVKTSQLRKSWTKNCIPRIIRLRNLIRVEGSLMGLVAKDLVQQISGSEYSRRPVMCNEISRSCDSNQCGDCFKQDRLQILQRRKELIDITLKTMLLMKRNRQLQNRLSALQEETKAFVDSVLSNPENRTHISELNSKTPVVDENL